jgi:hypothetical protein
MVAFVQTHLSHRSETPLDFVRADIHQRVLSAIVQIKGLPPVTAIVVPEV